MLTSPIDHGFFLMLVAIMAAFPGVNAGGFNDSYCAVVASSIYYKSPDNIILYNQGGQPTSNLSEAWGINHYDCENSCGAQDNSGHYSWGFISEGVASWLIPWLALSAQLPFETKDQTTNLVSLILALGSPALITYSLALTILNARWINRKFRQVKEDNATLRCPLQTEVVEAARSILIESQHIPFQIYNGPRREISQLIVRPENRAWWCSLQHQILTTKRKWTYSLYAQVGWVCASQLLAIINFFTSASQNTTIGIGLAINSLWLWMIPIVLGWVYVGTQDSAGSIKTALIDTVVPVLTLERSVSGKCVGMKDRTVFDTSSTRLQNISAEQSPSGNENPQNSGEPRGPTINLRLPNIDSGAENYTSSTPISLADRSDTSYIGDSESLRLQGIPGAESTLSTSRQQSQSHLDSEARSNMVPQLFLGFSVSGDELESGPIFNHTRVWSHMNAVKHITKALLTFTERQRRQQPVSFGKNWNKSPDRWAENFTGTPLEISRYISPNNTDVEDFLVHASASASLVLNCITAAFVAMFLQWGTTGAAIIIAYKWVSHLVKERS